jgi:hypothetical protein
MGFGAGPFCDERLARIGQWRLARIERAVRPTEAQRAAFEEFKTASARAIEITRTACPTEVYLTPTARLEAAEKQVEARLQAIRTVRPALQAFYSALSDEQKARFNALGRQPPGSADGGQGSWRPFWRHDGGERGRDQWDGQRRREQDRDGSHERRWRGGDGNSGRGGSGNPPSAEPQEERL